jgi:hypothetical protein
MLSKDNESEPNAEFAKRNVPHDVPHTVMMHLVP